MGVKTNRIAPLVATMLMLTPTPKRVSLSSMQTLREFHAQFPDDDACKRYLVAKRWPGKVACVRCGATERVYALKTRPFHWLCKSADCGGRNG